jgi:hypothetical protein
VFKIIDWARHENESRTENAATTSNLSQIDYPEYYILRKGGDLLGSVIKKRRKKMRKHKHRKLLARTRHQRRKGK